MVYRFSYTSSLLFTFYMLFLDIAYNNTGTFSSDSIFANIHPTFLIFRSANAIRIS